MKGPTAYPVPSPSDEEIKGAFRKYVSLHHVSIRNLRRGGKNVKPRFIFHCIIGALLSAPFVVTLLKIPSGIIESSHYSISFSSEPIRYCLAIAILLLFSGFLAYPFLAGVGHLARKIFGLTSAFDDGYREPNR